MRVVSSAARLLSVLKLRSNGWTYDAVNPELNDGLNAVFVPVEKFRLLLKLRFSAPPPQRICCTTPPFQLLVSLSTFVPPSKMVLGSCVADCVRTMDVSVGL